MCIRLVVFGGSSKQGCCFGVFWRWCGCMALVEVGVLGISVEVMGKVLKYVLNIGYL